MSLANKVTLTMSRPPPCSVVKKENQPQNTQKDTEGIRDWKPNRKWCFKFLYILRIPLIKETNSTAEETE